MLEKIPLKAPGSIITAAEWNQLARVVQAFVSIKGENGIYVNRSPLGLTIGQISEAKKIIQENKTVPIVGELRPVTILGYTPMVEGVCTTVIGRYVVGKDDDGHDIYDPPAGEDPYIFFVICNDYSGQIGNTDIRDCYPPLPGMLGIGAKLGYFEGLHILISPTVALPEVREAQYVGINTDAHSLMSVKLKKWDDTFYDDIINVKVLSYGNAGEHGFIDLNECLPKLDVGDRVLLKLRAKLVQGPPQDHWEDKYYLCISPHFIRVC